MSRSARSRLVRLGDVLATALFVAHFAHPTHRREFRCSLSATDYSPPVSPGGALRSLAMMQEGFYAQYGHYAARNSDLTELTLPKHWRAVVLSASAHRYRMRLFAPAEGGGGVVCHLWGRRARRDSIEPFEIDCRPLYDRMVLVSMVAPSRSDWH